MKDLDIYLVFKRHWCLYWEVRIHRTIPIWRNKEKTQHPCIALLFFCSVHIHSQESQSSQYGHSSGQWLCRLMFQDRSFRLDIILLQSTVNYCYGITAFPFSDISTKTKKPNIKVYIRVFQGTAIINWNAIVIPSIIIITYDSWIWPSMSTFRNWGLSNDSALFSEPSHDTLFSLHPSPLF